MNKFREIWQEILHGDNLDLYLIVPVAFITAILNLFGIVSDVFMNTITLAVLGILAVSALSNRHALSGLKITPSVNTIFQEQFPASLDEEVESATELWLIGITLNRSVKAYYPLIKQKLNKGHIVHVLTVHPDPDIVELVEMRAYSPHNVERTCNEIQVSLQYFCDLKQSAPDKLQIRTIRHPLGQGIMAMNPDSVSGVFYVANYPFKTQYGSQPKFVIRASDGHWYNLFRDELQNLWESGTEWKCEE